MQVIIPSLTNTAAGSEAHKSFSTSRYHPGNAQFEIVNTWKK